MNKRAAIGFLLFATALLLWWHRQQPADQATQTPLPTVESRQRQVAATSIAAPKPTPESDPAGWMEMRRKEVEEERQKGLNDWRTPIVFYGRVVDENMNPVSDAKIDFGWTDLSPSGSSEMQTASDNNGSFFLSGVKGKVLTVQVAKSGYYAFKAYPVGFFYAGANQNFVPDAANPVVFRLKKKGVAEPLVPMDGKFSVLKDGTPVEIDLYTGKQVPAGQGHFRVECWTEEPKARNLKYNWKCRITVPGGGLLVTTNQFNFQAPLTGYAELEEIDMPMSLNEQWGRTAKRNYFLKLNNGRYARASFEMISFNNHFFKIGVLINPSGSRNLEFDPAVQPKQTQFE